MKYEDIKRINESLTTVDVKGKDYVEVNKRVMAFRELQPEGAITTEIVSLENGVVVIKATVTGNDGIVLATGTAYEKESSSYINKTSYIENCETSAVGRALGFCGIGIDTSIASAEEVENAIEQQKNVEPNLATKKEKEIFLQRCEQLGVDYKEIAKQSGAVSMATMTKEQQGKCLIILKEIEEGKK